VCSICWSAVCHAACACVYWCCCSFPRLSLPLPSRISLCLPFVLSLSWTKEKGPDVATPFLMWACVCYVCRYLCVCVHVCVYIHDIMLTSVQSDSEWSNTDIVPSRVGSHVQVQWPGRGDSVRRSAAEAHRWGFRPPASCQKAQCFRQIRLQAHLRMTCSSDVPKVFRSVLMSFSIAA